MKAAFWMLTAGAVASAIMAGTLSRAADPVSVSLTRLDCGVVQVNNLNAFSDTNAYTGESKRFTASCYLIQHGETYMLWDTGLPERLKGVPANNTDPMSPTLTVTIKEQLAQLGITPEQISLIGISHYHFDHVSQADGFPQAKLLIGKNDWDALNSGEVPVGASSSALQHWIKGSGAVEGVSGDKDIFGDGSVIMLDTPGHTPGHHSLKVTLAKSGKYLLTGDLAHFHENYDSNGVPGFNTDRADTLASLERFKQLADNEKATVIIQHDMRDIRKLPAFPEAAR